MQTMNATALLVTALVAGGTFAAEPPPLGHPDFYPSSERPIGWRGDGSMCFPAATPPLEWDGHKGKNIVWSCPLPTFSQAASPIQVGDRIFVMSEPDILNCVHAGTGKILWSRWVNALLDREDDTKAEVVHASWDDPVPVLPCWLDVPRDPARAEFASGIRDRQIAAMARDQYWELTRGLLSHNPSQGYTGATYPCPVSDGEFVYICHGLDTAACLDLEGNLVWLRRITGDWGGMGNGSPALAGDILLLSRGNLGLDKRTGATVYCRGTTSHIPGWPPVQMARVGGHAFFLVGGNSPLGKGQRGNNALLACRASDGQIAGTYAPHDLNTTDGMISLCCVFGDKLYKNGFGRARDQYRALKIEPVDAEGKEVRFREIWVQKQPGNFGGSANMLPTVAGDLLAIPNDDNGGLQVIDRHTGRFYLDFHLLFPRVEKKMMTALPPQGTVLPFVFGEAGWRGAYCWLPIGATHDGNYLFMWSTDAACKVIKAGPEFHNRLKLLPSYEGTDGNSREANAARTKAIEVVATNFLPFRREPRVRLCASGMLGHTWFQGDRAYVRTPDRLWCIGDPAKPYRTPGGSRGEVRPLPDFTGISDVRKLVTALGETRISTRVAACKALAHLGKAALPAEDRLIECTLTDPAYDVRNHAAKALAALGDEPSPAVGIAFSRAFKDRDSEVALRALRSFPHAGRRAEGAISALIDVLRNSRSEEGKKTFPNTGEDAWIYAHTFYNVNIPDALRRVPPASLPIMIEMLEKSIADKSSMEIADVLSSVFLRHGLRSAPFAGRLRRAWETQPHMTESLGLAAFVADPEAMPAEKYADFVVLCAKSKYAGLIPFNELLPRSNKQKAKGAIPKLQSLLASEEHVEERSGPIAIVWRACRLIEAIEGQPPFAYCLEQLRKDPKDKAKRHYATAIALYGPRASHLVPDLKALIKPEEEKDYVWIRYMLRHFERCQAAASTDRTKP